MIETIKKLLLVARPISWPNTAYPFAAGYIVAGGSLDWVFVLGTLYFLIPYNLLMYGINDIFDYESDIRNPRKGGIEGMKLQRAFHPMIWRGVLITNIPFIGFLLFAGNLAASITLLVVLFFVVAYSVVKLRFKEIPVLDSISSSIHFVGPLLYALVLIGFDTAAWPFLIAFFAWGVASHAFGAVQDIIPDREGKLASIATYFGARATTYFSILLYTIASIIMLLQAFPVSLVGAAGVAYILNLLPYVRITDQTSAIMNRPWRRFIWLNLFTGFIVTIVLILRLV